VVQKTLNPQTWNLLLQMPALPFSVCYSFFNNPVPEGASMASAGDHLVLVAEGDMAARNGLVQQLGDSRYRIQCVRDLAELFARLRLESPSLLLLDQGFGGQDCLPLLPVFICDHPHLRIVIVTANGSIQDAVRAIKLGAFEYLAKPIDNQRLREILHNRDDASAFLALAPNGVPTIDQLERQAILAALRETHGRVRDAARLLGFGQATVYRKIKRYKIELENFTSTPRVANGRHQ
jgi:DNA-binding NtrC family response regulator